MKKIIGFLLSACMLLSIAAILAGAIPEETRTPDQSNSDTTPQTEQPYQLAEDISVTFSPFTAVAANETEYSMLGDSMGLIGLKWCGAKVADIRLNNGYNTGSSRNIAVWINAAFQTLYCMEPAAPIRGGTQVFNDYYTKERLTGVILQYGCMQMNNPVTEEQALYYLVTRVLVHEVILEERNAEFDYIAFQPVVRQWEIAINSPIGRMRIGLMRFTMIWFIKSNHITLGLASPLIQSHMHPQSHWINTTIPQENTTPTFTAIPAQFLNSFPLANMEITR